ncbi:MAG: YdcF family protein [Ruminococcus sp.]|nr:YdcF family protein [Ruminococcus sp.]
MENNILLDVKTLWDYLCLNEDAKEAKCIIGLGSILQIVPERCADLYAKGYSDLLIFSGNCGKGTEGVIAKTEAEIFKDCAMSLGVPGTKIMVENEATNTYENFKFIKEILASNNVNPESFIIVGKPYQERRAKAIANIELANKNISISSFKMPLEDFISYVEERHFMSIDDIINELVGEININLIAPKYGLQSYEEIPKNVLESYTRLLNKGYSRYIINDEIINSVLKSWETRGLH